MLSALKFVQGAVAKKEVVEGLTHFRIHNNVVKSYNGVMALCSPIAVDIDCTPLADPMIKAISNCDESVQLTLMSNGKLRIQSGKFRVAIPCTETVTPHVDAEGVLHEVDGAALMTAFATLQPFVSGDASRPWSNGILLKGQSAFATNNVIAAEYWVGSPLPIDCNIPRATINEMLRIKMIPTHVQIADTSITFHYEENKWIRTNLIETGWPDLTRILDKGMSESVMRDVPGDLFEAIEIIKPFTDKNGRIYFEQSSVRTHYDKEEGASHFINDPSMQGVYRYEMFNLLKGVAKQADFTKWPDACPFTADRLRGVIIGIRL